MFIINNNNHDTNNKYSNTNHDNKKKESNSKWKKTKDIGLECVLGRSNYCQKTKKFWKKRKITITHPGRDRWEILILSLVCYIKPGNK